MTVRAHLLCLLLAASCARTSSEPTVPPAASATPSAATTPAAHRTAKVREGGLVFLQLSNQPGPLIDSNAPPPPPGSTPSKHPFLSGSCGGGRPELCSRARDLLLSSKSYDEFLAKLRAAGFTVDEP